MNTLIKIRLQFTIVCTYGLFSVREREGEATLPPSPLLEL